MKISVFKLLPMSMVFSHPVAPLVTTGHSASVVRLFDRSSPMRSAILKRKSIMSGLHDKRVLQDALSSHKNSFETVSFSHVQHFDEGQYLNFNIKS